MPAIAKLKVMPRGCIGCPFSILGAYDECECVLLDYNGVEYLYVPEENLLKQRRKECPLILVDKGFEINNIKAEGDKSAIKSKRIRRICD